MNPEKLQDAIGMVGEDLVQEAKTMAGVTHPHKNNYRIATTIAIIGILVVVLLSAGLLRLFPKNNYKNVETEVPTASIQENSPILSGATALTTVNDLSPEDVPPIYAEDLKGFLKHYFRATIPVVLSSNPKENVIFSPLNTYLSLSILAETASGSSRTQLLHLLEAETLQTLRENARKIWITTNTKDNGVSSQLANSVWLNRFSYKAPTLQTIADYYFATTYQGEMGSQLYNQLLQDWFLNHSNDAVNALANTHMLKSDMQMVLASTMNFQAEWMDNFLPSDTRYHTFRGITQDVVTDFMYQFLCETYYQGNKFSAVKMDLKDNYDMWFILPNDTINVYDLLSNQELLDFLSTNDKLFENKYSLIHLSVPKFDISSTLDMNQSLQTLGVTHILDRTKSNFSSLSESSTDITISRINHSVHLSVDERGCTTHSYTDVQYLGGYYETEQEIDFVLDRPFLFTITSSRGLPVFVGIINQIG